MTSRIPHHIIMILFLPLILPVCFYPSREGNIKLLIGILEQLIGMLEQLIGVHPHAPCD